MQEAGQELVGLTGDDQAPIDMSMQAINQALDTNCSTNALESAMLGLLERVSWMAQVTTALVELLLAADKPPVCTHANVQSH